METNRLNIGYARVSTLEQVTDGFSIEAQKNRITNEFESLGISEYIIFEENGVSAKNLKRKQMKHLIELINEGEVDKIIIYKLDRLTRSLMDLIFF